MAASGLRFLLGSLAVLAGLAGPAGGWGQSLDQAGAQSLLSEVDAKSRLEGGIWSAQVTVQNESTGKAPVRRSLRFWRDDLQGSALWVVPSADGASTRGLLVTPDGPVPLEDPFRGEAWRLYPNTRNLWVSPSRAPGGDEVLAILPLTTVVFGTEKNPDGAVGFEPAWFLPSDFAVRCKARKADTVSTRSGPAWRVEVDLKILSGPVWSGVILVRKDDLAVLQEQWLDVHHEIVFQSSAVYQNKDGRNLLSGLTVLEKGEGRKVLVAFRDNRFEPRTFDILDPAAVKPLLK